MKTVRLILLLLIYIVCVLKAGQFFAFIATDTINIRLADEWRQFTHNQSATSEGFIEISSDEWLFLCIQFFSVHSMVRQQMAFDLSLLVLVAGLLILRRIEKRRKSGSVPQAPS